MDTKSNWTESKRIEIIRWLAIAMNDRGLGGVAVEAGYLENSIYNFQQAAEKLLKAFLLANDVSIEKTHNIDSLIISASKIDPSFLNFDVVGIGSRRLSELATYYRYPNMDRVDKAQADEVAGSIKFVDSLFEHLEGFLGEDVIADALEYTGQKSNPFKDSASEVISNERFVRSRFVEKF